MTLNEAIAKYREKVEYFKRTTNFAYAKELEQLAEWLEELKANKVASAETYESGYKRGYREGYNKAIDDFAEKLQEKCSSIIHARFDDGTAPVSWSHAYADFKDDIEQVAEQLKEGAVDG